MQLDFFEGELIYNSRNTNDVALIIDFDPYDDVYTVFFLSDNIKHVCPAHFLNGWKKL